MSWHRLIVDVAGADAELVADALWQLGTDGVEERSTPGDDGVQLIAGFATGAAAEAASRRLAEATGLTPSVEPIVEDGLDGWRAWARPWRVGRFTVTPPWCEPPSDDTEILWIDPGRTFGSGSHPTTRLVLGALERLVVPGCRVLDVGTGSGVLAIASARCGAASVDAIDIDPGSPAVVAANAEENGVGSTVHATTTPLAVVADDVRAGGAPYEVVLANLLAPTFVDLGADLVAALAPHGHLVISGVLDDQRADVVARFGPQVQVEDVTVEDGWAAVVLRRGGGR